MYGRLSSGSPKGQKMAQSFQQYSLVQLPPLETEGNIPARFRTVARCLPEHPAVVDISGATSYAALDAFSDRLAAQLVARFGSEPEPVGLLLPNTVAMIIGIMGVLKAGKFYTPLDPLTNLEAQLEILHASTAAILLTNRDLLPVAKQIKTPDMQIMMLDELDAGEDMPAPNPVLNAGSYASVAFTSGSTGRPKGVIWHHGGWLNRARQCYNYDQFRSTDRVAQILSPAFGLYSTVVLATLLNGASVVYPSAGDTDVWNLLQWLHDQSITVWFTPVGLLREVLAAPHRIEKLPAMRAILPGGQQLLAKDLSGLPALVPPNCVISNRLSMSEVQMATRYAIEAHEIKPSADPLPVGYACEENEVFLMNEEGDRVAPGEVGQIIVRSRYLSPGYWRDPELTATKFLPDPDGGERRILLTGDMGRMRPGGCLEHVGRMDFMLKIRGYRVEPETIDAALMGHPAVRESVVVAHPGRSGELQLVAYLSVQQECSPSVSELRELLAQSLPTYMIPTRFVYLESLPHNASGKIDRKALPPPSAQRPNLDTPFVAPCSDLERHIATIWAGLLELDEVGLHDNFFDLGGDSLTAVRMMLQVEEVTSRGVSLDFLRMPTVAQLAGLIKAGEAAEVASLPSTLAMARSQRKHPVTGPRSRWQSLRKLIKNGPVWGSHALPYAIGVKLQHMLLRQSVVHNRILSKQSSVFRRCLSEAELTDPTGAHLTLHLMLNNWLPWRKQAMELPFNLTPWVVLDGAEHVHAAMNGGTGLIIVFAHQAILRSKGVRRLFPEYISREIQSFRADYDRAVRTQHTREAIDLLRRGGILFIAGDSGNAANPLELPFYGRMLPVPRGPAELALHSGASIVALFSNASIDGRIKLEFVRLATPASQAESEELVYRYTASLAKRWPELLPTMKSGTLHKHLMLPHTSGEQV
jgi:amino acid adenylation domain-containing protein